MREMKDSGIEWIGTIPFDWKCCKQKYEIQLINGRAYSDSEFEEDGKYRILRVGNLFSNPTSIIESKKQQLTVIDSYKKSLIYEYVTGKKEVI